MPGRGPAPKADRRRANEPVRGEWQPTPNAGWQHSETLPEPPEGLKPASLTAWNVWMCSWVAAHWTENDLPGLRTLILTYDQVERGEFQRGPELRLLMDTYGITPKGQQDRRWAAPKPTEEPAPVETPSTGRYAHLKAV